MPPGLGLNALALILYCSPVRLSGSSLLFPNLYYLVLCLLFHHSHPVRTDFKMAIQSSGSADAVRKIVDASQVLSNEGLESWSHVSEDTRKYLSQIPWIREKVNPQEKDTNALQGAGSWSTSPEPIGVTPENDVASINLDIGVPEFSPRRTDSDAPSKKPIAEVLDEVRSTLKYMKVCLPMNDSNSQFC